MAKGRKTGGKPKGYKAPHTLEKLEAREAARKLITAHLEPILRAQIANAIGIGQLYQRDKTGKFTLVEDPEMIDALLTQGKEKEHYWIFTKAPNTQAAQDLLNRALDKPIEAVEVTGKNQGPLEIIIRKPWGQSQNH